MKGNLQEQKSLLSSALKDLNREIIKLKKTKDALEKRFKRTGSNISLTQSRETELRNQLSLLISQEANLNKQKEKVQQKLNDLKVKLDKVTKISRDLEQV